MKKALTILLMIVCVCSLLAVSANAAPDPMAVKFDDALGLLDHFYDYDYHYMIRIATDEFISWDDEDMWKPTSVSAEAFDATLHKYFVITEQQIIELRELGNRDYSIEIYDEEAQKVTEVIPFFNETTQTYTFEYYGGFGGSLAPRRYLGYVKNGTTYDVYYQNITRACLQDYLPEGVNEWEYAEELGWPEYIDMAGIRFECGPEEYTAILSYDDFGRKYTVELNGDVVRIISCTEYTKKDLPDAFDDNTEVIYDLPPNGDVIIPENECFTPGTVVKVEKLSNGTIFNVAVQSMEKIAEKFQVFEFTAQMDETAVQPDGKLSVTFTIPEGYSSDVTVYYMDSTGKLELVPFTVDALAGTVTAQLSHFSTYIIVDNKSKPHEHVYTAVVTPSTCTAEGYTTHTCDCKDSYIDSKTPVVDHSYGKWTVTKAPTVELNGEEKRECANCDHFETRPIDILTQPDDSDEPENTPTNTDTKNSFPVLVAVIAAAVIVLGVAAVAVIAIRKRNKKA